MTARPAKRAARAELVAVSDFETRGSQAPHGDLRLWLRILTIHKLVNNEVRRRLREKFGMMVTTGNITGLVDELVAEGLVERLPDPTNRRASLAAMTARGRKLFDAAARANETWIEEMFAGLTTAEKAAMFDMFGRQKADIAARLRPAETGAPDKGSSGAAKRGRK